MLAGPDIEILAFVPCVPGFNEFRIYCGHGKRTGNKPPRQYLYLSSGHNLRCGLACLRRGVAALCPGHCSMCVACLLAFGFLFNVLICIRMETIGLEPITSYLQNMRSTD